MKFFIFMTVVITLNLNAQQKQPTSQKELEETLKKAQQQLDRLSAEDKKLLEKMGIPTKLSSRPPGTSESQFGAATGNDEIPKKNPALVNSISKQALTTATVGEYTKTVYTYIDKNLAPNRKTIGQKLHQSLLAEHYDAQSIGNVAVGLWASGIPDIALYLSALALNSSPGNTDLTSNFSAMLTMGGMAHKAIPLLEYLNKQFPSNTTLLNNLGQAWFQLGEIEKADAFLEKVVGLFANHPQANYTQCLIQESKGNKNAAIEKMKKSLAYSYSADKVNKLRKLGYSVKAADMRIPFRPDPDPLGLANFKRPEVPESFVTEMKLNTEWDEFQKQLQDKISTLATEMIPKQKATAQKAEQVFDQYKNGGIASMDHNNQWGENIYRTIAEKNLSQMNKDGGATYRLRIAKKQIDDIFKDFKTKELLQRKAIEKESSVVAENDSELGRKGEDLGYDICVVQRKYSEWVYAKYNKPLEQAYKNYLHQLYLKITEEIYWRQFTTEPDQFTEKVMNAQIEWLSALSGSRYIGTKLYGNDCGVPETKLSRYRLTHFEDINCQYRSQLDFVFAKQIYECGKARVEFNMGKFSGNLNFKSDDAGNNRFVRGTLEANVFDKSISVDKGPVEIGASVKAGVGVEFTSRGVEDFYVTAEASASVKSNIVKTFDQHISEAHGNHQPSMGDAQLGDKGIDIGVKGRMSLISGNSSTNVFVNAP